MQKNSKKIVVGITGASGSCYAYQLLSTLVNIGFDTNNIAVVFSKNGFEVFEYELGKTALKFVEDNFNVYDNSSFMAPFASGSSEYDTLVVSPCSMGTLGRIASGFASDLIARTADVMLKERRKLILVTREAPLSLMHIENMLKVTKAGGVICPACPSFYSKPADMDSLIATITERILSLCGIDYNGYKWQS